MRCLSGSAVSGAGKIDTHLQSLLHSTGSDPAPTVAHVLPRDSSGAPLAPPSRRREQITACGRRPVVDSCGHAHVLMSLRGASGHDTPPRPHAATLGTTGTKSVHSPGHSRHANTQQHAKSGPDEHTQSESMRSISGRRWSKRGAARASGRPTHGQSDCTPWCPGAAASSERRRPCNSCKSNFAQLPPRHRLRSHLEVESAAAVTCHGGARGEGTINGHGRHDAGTGSERKAAAATRRHL